MPFIGSVLHAALWTWIFHSQHMSYNVILIWLLFHAIQADNLSDALKKLKITAVDSTADSLEGCLDCLLQALAQNSKSYCFLQFHAMCLNQRMMVDVISVSNGIKL